MDGISDSSWLKWKRKRRNTFIAFSMVGIITGMDHSVIATTLYLYLRDMVKPDKPEMYYGIITAIFFVSAGIFGAFSGRWLDNTRKVRYYVNFALLVQIFGFAFYTMPYLATVLVGRAICGMGASFPNVITGEVFRIYDKMERNRAMLWIGSLHTFGFIIGPSFNIFFEGIEIKLGPLEINYLNFVGIFMSGLLLVVLIIASILVHDCSAEIDLKEIMKRTADNTDIAHGNSNSKDITDGNTNNKEHPNNEKIIDGTDVNDLLMEEIERGECTEEESLICKPCTAKLNHTSKQFHGKEIPIKSVFKNLASNTETALIFVATFILVYTVYGASLVLTLIIINDLKWSVAALNVSFAGYGVAYLFFLPFMYIYFNSNRSVYNACLISIVSVLVVNALLICFKLLQRNRVRDISMMVMYLIFLVLSWSGEDTLLRIMLANSVPSKIQSFSETLRSVVTRAAIIVASLSVPNITPWLHWWASAMLIPVFLLLLGFIGRRKYFINPQEITFSES